MVTSGSPTLRLGTDGAGDITQWEVSVNEGTATEEGEELGVPGAVVLALFVGIAGLLRLRS